MSPSTVYRHLLISHTVLLTEGGEQSGGRAQGVRQRSGGERGVGTDTEQPEPCQQQDDQVRGVLGR